MRQLLGDSLPLQFRQPEFEVYAIRASPHELPATPDRLALLDAQVPAPSAQPGQPIVWRTHWAVNGASPQRRLKLFFHVLNDKSEVIADDDREDLNFATLSEGASFYQISRLTLPPDLPSGQYPVEVGWYNPETGERLNRADGSDRTLLPSLEVTAP